MNQDTVDKEDDIMKDEREEKGEGGGEGEGRKKGREATHLLNLTSS